MAFQKLQSVAEKIESASLAFASLKMAYPGWVFGMVSEATRKKQINQFVI
jgi:hypothetical protein